jgi:uncharacterized protein YbjT (DUF2867 family)
VSSVICINFFFFIFHPSSFIMLILVTGATGYIASRLIPRLLDSGYRVRALARHPRRLDGRGWSHQIEIVPGDVMIPSTLAPALKGVDTAYYLIHNMSSGRGYTERELEAARNFACAAAQAGVQHIIYLGGLADPEQHIAPHMRSRIETGRTLSQGKVPVTEFRAGVIIGSGSISFEMIRFMTELFPIVPGPVWFHNRSQPIAVQNVIDYLFAALTNPNGRGQIFEIGGPEITYYKELMLKYAQARGIKRSLFLLPYVPVRFMAFGVALMTPVPYPIAYALVGGLSDDSIVKHDEVLRVFPEVKLIGINEATRKALGYLSPVHVERVWEDGQRGAKSLKHEGFFILHREAQIHAPLEKVFSAAAQVAKKMKWQVEASEPHRRLLVRRTYSFGERWLEWRVSWDNITTYLTQTAFFAPRGLGGFVYWYLLYPFHVLGLRGLIQSIAREAQTPVFSQKTGV